MPAKNDQSHTFRSLDLAVLQQGWNISQGREAGHWPGAVHKDWKENRQSVLWNLCFSFLSVQLPLGITWAKGMRERMLTFPCPPQQDFRWRFQWLLWTYRRLHQGHLKVKAIYGNYLLTIKVRKDNTNQVFWQTVVLPVRNFENSH